MIEKEEIQKRSQEIAEERHSDSVFREILEREKEREKYEKRWFWELLQNAKDSVNSDKKIKIKIEISDDKISFSHTGNPFELDDILSLIIQGSSKNNKEGKTGRFGTGFITTYLLSKEVQISGCLTENKGYFNFILNRNAADYKDFYDKYIQSKEDFTNSMQSASYLKHSEFQTEFSYTLGELGQKTAKTGLDNIYELIPITQLFNEQIESVEIIENCKSTKFEKKQIERHDEEKIIKWEVKTIIDNKENHDKIFAYVLQADNYEACISTQIKDHCEIIRPFTEEYPRLFYTFPLIGTEKTGIPVIINSTNFDPKVERDGIYLSDTENEKIKQNRAIINDALFNSCRKYALLFAQKNIQNRFELFDFRKSKDYDWIDHGWFEKIKIDALDILSEIDFLPFYEGGCDPINLKKLSIPYSLKREKSELVWNLIYRLSGLKVPIKKEQPCWIQVIENLKEIKGCENAYELEYVWEIGKIVKHITQNYNSLDELEKGINGDAVDWLNELYSALTEIKEDFPKEPILLNQDNKLRTADGIFWDECKDNDLVEISKLIQLNFSEKLISQDIKEFEIYGVKKFTVDDAITELKEKINNFEAANFEKSGLVGANAKFLKWLIKSNKIDVIKELKVLRNEKEEYDCFSKSNHLLLSPKSFFGNRYPLFKELIRDKDCLHNDYYKILDDNDFSFLNDNGFIHQYPLIVKKEIATKEVLKILEISDSDLALLCDEGGQLKEENKFEIEYSDFAYLTTNDGHIYKRNDSQDSSLERLKFLFMEAPQNDKFFEEDEQVLSKENMIRIKKCFWVYRAKQLNWVNVKTIDENRKTKWSGEKPSSSNLSELIKRDKNLVTKINEDKIQKLLSSLGIGVSELIRNSLPDEKTKQTWDKAITSMLTSDIKPDLALEIFNDHHIREEYEKRLVTKNLISRNQKIGYLVENLFSELIKNTDKITIERKPFGSDYIISKESSDLVNEEHKEEIFQINNWFIELKATGKDYAAMTELQARTAVEKKENYALIVAELDGTEPDIEYLRKYAKVISDIGHKIEGVYSDFQDVTNKKNSLDEGKNGISVYFEDQNIRFRINSKIWKEEIQTIEIFLKDKFKM
jgi:hypothetical protein